MIGYSWLLMLKNKASGSLVSFFASFNYFKVFIMSYDFEIFGFVINGDVQFDIANKRLIRFSTETENHAISFGAVHLSLVMVRFLTCLLIGAAKGEQQTSKETILQEVWDNYNLVSSHQKLWKTLRDLRLKLISIGIDEGFIVSERKGYSLFNYSITPLFVQKNYFFRDGYSKARDSAGFDIMPRGFES